MTDLAIITPSRGRPESIMRLVNALAETCTTDWRLWVGVDDDDLTGPEYGSALGEHDYDLVTWGQEDPIAKVSAVPWSGRVTVVVDVRAGLSAKTNQLAKSALSIDAPRYLASLGDDHVPRKRGWDRQLIDAIEAMPGPGWAYGNDLLVGERIPTAWVQSAQLVDALGWMMLPTCQHLCVDSAVYDLGHAAGRIAYLPDVVIEHMHPAAGKASEDHTHWLGNNALRVYEDGQAYQQWRAEQLDQDAATVKALRWLDRLTDGPSVPA